ncbi:MAG: UDP-N-acetylglucosamine 2-epimerase (non-hydrolyzing) [Planctomycetota bacterium]
MKRRVAVLMGTRPEAIKLAPVIAALAADDALEPVVINTGQHRELIDQVISLFGIHVDRDLAVMQPNQSLATLTGRLVTAIDETLVALDPDLVLVQGDTTTVLAGALASFYRRVPVGHVEAGLRTGDLASPFPEEANRKLTTTLAAMHYAPTERSRDNLLAERVERSAIFVTGNTVIDALQLEVARQQEPAVRNQLTTQLAGLIGEDVLTRPMVLVTGHRRENFGDGFQQICDALSTLANRHADTLFVYPVHLNPNVKAVVHERLGGAENIRLVGPQPYSEFVALLDRCQLVLTDSGGVQEEAPSLGKPVLVMRNTTERPEGVDAGTVRLVGPVAAAIVEHVDRLLTDPDAYRQMAEAANPYGDGHASGRIVEAIHEFFDT